MKSGVLIDEYVRAACVQSRPANGLRRTWNHVIQGSGCVVRVVGAVQSTGFVAVEYPPDNVSHVVSDFGEKSNPLDVRVDVPNCRLYVWSTGSPIFDQRPPTHLVEYDLRNRRELQNVTVDFQAMPACPGGV
jgi:hypothetical protein